MTWGRRFRRRQYLRSSLWVWPVVGGVLGGLLAPLVVRLDEHVTLPDFWTYSPSTASTVMTTIVGAAAALTGFVVTVSVLVVQMATGTFSARYMRVWYRDPMLKAVLALLVGIIAFSLTILRRVGSTFVPNLGVVLAGFFVLASLVLFMLFLDRFIHRLRPVAVAAIAAQALRDTLAGAEDALTTGVEAAPVPLDGQVETVTTTEAGAIQAVHVRGLVSWAAKRQSRVILCHAVGDFVPADVVLLEVHGRLEHGDAERLRDTIALGDERTVEQDPSFPIRIMVDVAIRALSPAVNDPTTAVQVIDYLDDVLRHVGQRTLGPWAEARLPDGSVALAVPTRSWEDYVALSVTEIREYGGNSVQVVRRLRVMLEELRTAVRPEYVAALDEELARLDATVSTTFGASVDLDRARVADRQGIGGPKGVRA